MLGAPHSRGMTIAMIRRALFASLATTVALAPATAQAAALDGAALRWPWALPFAGILVTIAIGLALLPVFARLMRGEVLRVKQEGYIDAARWIGVSRVRTIATHILPNVAPSLLVLATFTVGSAVLIASALSFLGLGVGGTTPDWGLMLANGQEYITRAWWDVTMPGLAITALVLSVNLLGDRVRDRLDPRTGHAVGAARRGMLLGNRWGRR